MSVKIITDSSQLPAVINTWVILKCACNCHTHACKRVVVFPTRRLYRRESRTLLEASNIAMDRARWRSTIVACVVVARALMKSCTKLHVHSLQSWQPLELWKQTVFSKQYIHILYNTGLKASTPITIYSKPASLDSRISTRLRKELSCYYVERGSSVVECRTHNRESPGSNLSLLPFRRLGIFVLSIDAPVDSAI